MRSSTARHSHQTCERPFGIEQTHGILLRPEHRIFARSDELGWSSIYASLQHEAPYADDFRAVDDHLIVLHLVGPVGVRRRLGKAEERRVIPPGGLFILPGGVDFGVTLENELDSLHIYLRQELVQEVADELGLCGAGIEILPSLGEPDLLAERLALGVRDALTEGDPAAGVYADYLSRALAARLLREHSAYRPRTSPARGGLTTAQLKLATDYMEANLERSLTLAELGRACGLSPTHFARRFKTAVGAPPHQRLMQLRVERAKRLLLSGLSIVEVALACGFAHQEHLTTVFRRRTGVTPGSFRRLARN
ncbi:MAG: AraC family transcriptional regulator [Caulobacteraceae bacterium]|nr:AraC family transcriptional regulator [Caulobacteraceae bacterium]